VLDLDSSVSPTHGEQENSVWNGHYACTCYHPLFVFNQFGDLERCTLRPGNVHGADGWESVFKPVIVRYQGKVLRIYFRADAAFAMPGVYECLEAERIRGATCAIFTATFTFLHKYKRVWWSKVPFNPIRSSSTRAVA
jgi:hypothetical protein